MPVRYRRSEVLTSETELALGVCWLPGIAMSCQDLSGNGLHVWGSARLHINNGCVVKQHRQGVIREKQRRLCEQIENQPLPAGKPRWKRKTSAKFSGELWIYFFFFTKNPNAAFGQRASHLRYHHWSTGSYGGCSPSWQPTLCRCRAAVTAAQHRGPAGAAAAPAAKTTAIFQPWGAHNVSMERTHASHTHTNCFRQTPQVFETHSRQNF